MDYIKTVYWNLFNNSLYRNSAYLMLSTAIMAGLGFFFWIIAAKIYSSEQIGITTSLISVASLIAGISLLGFNNGLIRFLPKNTKKNEIISVSFIFVCIAACILSTIYLLNINTFSSKLLFIKHNLFYSAIFILFIVSLSINSIIESILISFRTTGYILIKNSLLSSLKIFFVSLLVFLGTIGVFASVTFASIIAIVFGIVILLKKHSYKFTTKVKLENAWNISKFSVSNYIGYFIGGIHTMILPTLIMNRLGTKESAFFYIDLMIANVLYIIPLATTQALLAEGTHNPSEILQHTKKAFIYIIVLLLLPICFIYFFGNYVLLLFGKIYMKEGITLLKLLSFTAIFVSVSYIGNTIMTIFHKNKLLIIINSINAALVLSSCYILSTKGLFGIGVGILSSEVIMSVIQLTTVKRLLVQA